MAGFVPPYFTIKPGHPGIVSDWLEVVIKSPDPVSLPSFHSGFVWFEECFQIKKVFMSSAFNQGLAAGRLFF